MGRRVLIVVAETAARQALTVAFADSGFDARPCDTLEGSLVDARRWADVIVLDLGGRTADPLRALRAVSSLPVLVVSDTDSELERIIALEVGADVFVPRPCSPREMVARVRALLRRRDIDRDGRGHVLEAAGLTIDLLRLTVLVDGAPVAVTGTEFRLLAILADRAGLIVLRKELVHTLWNNSRTADHACDVLVSAVRRKIDGGARRQGRIRTIRGVGYRLVDVGRRAADG